jgi:hypothetical protein
MVMSEAKKTDIITRKCTVAQFWWLTALHAKPLRGKVSGAQRSGRATPQTRHTKPHSAGIARAKRYKQAEMFTSVCFFQAGGKVGSASCAKRP